MRRVYHVLKDKQDLSDLELLSGDTVLAESTWEPLGVQLGENFVPHLVQLACEPDGNAA